MKANDNHNEVIENTLLRGRVKLLQPKVGFHAGLDSVFLAAAVPVRDKWQVMDIGCGVGAAGLCVYSRNNNIHLTGLDIQREVLDLALQNATLNDASDRCRFFQGDLKHEKVLENNHYHSVLMNPPYQQAGTHTPSPRKIKAFSHGEDASGATLNDWVKYAHRKLKQGGYMTMIHRADRLDDIITTLTARRWFGGIEIYPLWSHAGDDAKRVIIRARKERYAALRLKPGIVVHNEDGSYTENARAILEDGAEIAF
jgi:tRNA1(Val) A37 N6-methylase TrmN6